ncbi:MAG: PAS domain S-box protein, partial [Desulfovibrionaceae bacterium]|nr:PAS domain S-box protein [Desulfovibrionaceae bacterium]
MRAQLLQQHIGIVELAPEGDILDANDYVLSMFGCTLQCLQGKRFDALYAAADATSAEYGRRWNEIVRNDKTIHMHLCRRGSGAFFWLRATYHTLRHANGETERVIALCEDVSELMHETQANAVQLAAVGRALLVVVISPSGECLSANENCLHTLGLSWEELSGRNILDVFGLLLVPGELGKIRSRLRMGGSHSLRLRWPRFDGSVIQLDAWLVPVFDADKKMHKIMLLAADVTTRVGRERRKLERYRHLAEASDRSGRAVAIT